MEGTVIALGGVTLLSGVNVTKLELCFSEFFFLCVAGLEVGTEDVCEVRKVAMEQHHVFDQQL